MADPVPGTPGNSPLVVFNNPPSQQQAPASAPAAADPPDFLRGMTKEKFEERLASENVRGQRAALKAMGVPKDQRDQVLADVQAGKLVLTPKPAEGAPDYAKEYQKLDAVQKRNAALEGEIKALADSEYSTLPEPLQKFFAATLPDEPTARLKAVRAAREHGLAGLTPAAPADPKVAKPATTIASPGPGTPKPAGTLNHFESWKALVDSGQSVRAAHYLSENRTKIEEQRPRK